MPRVGNKRFPYTPSGIKQAQQAYDRKRNPLASAMAGFNRKQKFGAALNQLRNRDRLRDARADLRNQGLVNQLKDRVTDNARLRDQAESLLTPNQRVATQPNRRQAIATQIGQDKVYRPDRDGPKRPLPGPIRKPFGRPAPGRGPLPIGSKRPGRGPLGVGGMRPSRRPIRPGRGAIAPRPWRPKPPNRKYL